MRGASFPRWAALSLAIHLGLGVAATGLEARRAPPVPSSKGSSESHATSASADVGGETFELADEVPDLEAPSEAPPRAAAANDPGAAGSADLELDDSPTALTDDRTLAVNASRHPSHPSHPTRAAAAAAEPPPPPPLYGAIGDRAASDLVTAFKKQFATGASSDPIWNQVPVGFYAAGDVTFYLSTEGRLLHTTLSESAAPAFRAAVARTVALIKGRSFTARGERTHLRIVVRVSGDLVNHGAFTVNAEGSFELPSGRHVSVRVDER